MPLTALITRPEEDARPLAEALLARGVATVIEPLLAIRPLPETAADLVQDLVGVQALLFTSANGARAFAELSPRRDIGVLAVGDATTAAARALGFAAVESAGGDAKDLARLARERLKPASGALFHAAGSAVAGDLAQLLAADGFELRRRMLYESRTADALTPETIAVLKHRRISLVLLFSPRTAATFAELAQAAGVETGNLTAVCLSPAVADAVRALPWRVIETAARPDLPSLLELVDRLNPKPEAPSPATAAAEAPESTTDPAAEPAPAPPAEAAAPRPAEAPRSSAPATPIPTVVPASRSGGASVFLAGLIGALIAAAAVAAVLRFAPGKLGLAPAGSASTATASAATAPATDFAAEIADLSARLESLQKQVDALPKEAPDLGDLPAKLAALQQQVAVLQTATAAAGGSSQPPPAAIPAEIKELPARLDALDRRSKDAAEKLAAVEQRLAAAEQKPNSVAALTDLKAAVDGLGQQVKGDEAALADLAGLKQQVAALSAASGESRRAAAGAGLALGLAGLKGRIAAGEPFAGELAAVAKLAAADPALDSALAPSLAALKPDASAGAPTLGTLQAEFPAAEEAIRRAGTGAAALPPGAGLGARVLARLESLVTIRPVAEGGEEAVGDSVAARLARADARLGKGDLAGAGAELAALAGPAAEAAKPWLDRARRRLAVDAAAEKLDAAALAALAGGAQP